MVLEVLVVLTKRNKIQNTFKIICIALLARAVCVYLNILQKKVKGGILGKSRQR